MPTPSLSVDLFQVTLVLCVALMIIAFGVTSNMRFARTYLRLWNIGGLAVAIGMTLIVMRGEILDFVSIIPGNLALIAGYTALAVGTKRYLGRPAYYDMLLGALFAIGFSIAYASGAPVVFRIAIFSAFSILSSASVLLGLWKARHSGQHAAIVRLATVVLPILLLTAVIRGTLAAGILELPVQVALLKSLLGLGVLATLCLSLLLVVATMEAGARSTLQAADLPEADVLSQAGTEVVNLADGSGVGGWELVHSRCALISPCGTELKLTGNEYLLLKRLFHGGKEPVQRTILNAIVGRDATNPKDRAVDILLSRLRRKCHEAGTRLPVQSVRGRGYVFHGETRTTADGSEPLFQ